MLRLFVRSCRSRTPRFDIAGVEQVPGGARCCWPRTTAATSTSPRWRGGACDRPAGAVPGQEGGLRRAGRRADRSGHRRHPRRPRQRVRRPSVRPRPRCKAGEVVIVLPQGTIPRGYAFFDPVLHGKTGMARLAGSTGAPVVPVGLWGTEQVWPRSARCPTSPRRNPPKVTVRVGKPVSLSLTDAVADTEAIMQAISALLPGRVAGAPRADPRGIGAHQAASVRTRSPARRRVRSTRRHADSDAGRGRWPAAGSGCASTRGCSSTSARPARRARVGDERKDHDHPAADGGAGDGRCRREQRDRFEHAAGPRGRAGRRPTRARAVLEVDEVWLPRVLSATGAAAVVLLNLSRDQLDRTNEVRMVAGRWRAAWRRRPGRT